MRSTPGNEPSSWIRRVVTLLVLGALVSPALRDHDSLPLSTYPMYSGVRGNESTYVTASGIDRQGATTTLSALTIAGSRDRLIAQSFLNDAVRRGDADVICPDIAARAGDQLVAIEIATERHDTIARLQGEPSLLERELHSTCPVAP